MEPQRRNARKHSTLLNTNEDGQISGHRFREVHYHRFPLELRSFINGFCVLKTCLPTIFSRPVSMQTVYSKPPPNLYNPCLEEVYLRLNGEHTKKYRNHFIAATATGLAYFVSGDGYWNILDISLGLKKDLESCLGILAFEILDEATGNPNLVFAITTHCMFSYNSGTKTRDTYKLHIVGASALPEVSKLPGIDLSSPLKKHAVGLSDDLQKQPHLSADEINNWPFLEQRLFCVNLSRHKNCLQLNYIPMDLSYFINKYGLPEICVSGSDNTTHNYLLSKNDIFEIMSHEKVDSTSQTQQINTSDPEIGENEGEGENKSKNSRQNKTYNDDDNGNDNDNDNEKRSTSDEPSDIHKIIFASKKTTTHDGKKVEIQIKQNNLALMIYDSEDIPILKDSQKFEYPVLKSLVYHLSHKNLGRLALALSFVKKFVIVYHDISFLGLDTEPMMIPSSSEVFNDDKFETLLFPIIRPKQPVNQNSNTDTNKEFKDTSSADIVRGGVYALPRSDEDGLVTCIAASDLDYDGICELILGTTNGVLLIYKLVCDSMNQEGYALVYKKKFKSPIYNVVSIDLNTDGLNELLISTLLGVHILQPNLALARKVLIERLIPQK